MKRTVSVFALALMLGGCATRSATITRNVDDVQTYQVTTVEDGTFTCFSIKQGGGTDSWGGIHCWKE